MSGWKRNDAVSASELSRIMSRVCFYTSGQKGGERKQDKNKWKAKKKEVSCEKRSLVE